MKKQILILALVGLSISAMAQSNKKVVKAQVKQEVLQEDTTLHLQTYKDMGLRMQAMANLAYAVTNPNDITANQKQRTLFFADSLFKVDLTQLQKINALKAKKK